MNTSINTSLTDNARSALIRIAIQESATIRINSRNQDAFCELAGAGLVQVNHCGGHRYALILDGAGDTLKSYVTDEPANLTKVDRQNLRQYRKQLVALGMI